MSFSETQRRKITTKRRNYKIILPSLVVLILVISFVVRWYNIEKHPYGLIGDELSWIVTSYFEQYDIPAGEKVFGLYTRKTHNYFPVSVVIIQASFDLFGNDIYSAKKILAVFSTVSILGFYLLSTKFLSKRVSLIIALLFSLSFYKIMTSRMVVPGNFSDLFVYFGIFLLLTIDTKRKFYKNSLLSLGAGILVTLPLFTYNLAYTLPFISVAILSIVCFQKRISIKKSLIYLALLTLPLIATSYFWTQALMGEFVNKSFSFNNSSFDVQTLTLNFGQLVTNITAIYQQLFRGLTYSISGEFTGYSVTLFPVVISLLFIAGVVVAIFNFKKYAVLLVWLIVQFIGYHIVFGLYLPRMWFLTAGLIFIFAGIAIEAIIKNLQVKDSFSRALVWYIVAVCIVIITIESITPLLNNDLDKGIVFKKSTRELLEHIKNNNAYLGNGAVIVLPEQRTHETDIGEAYSMVTFLLLADGEHDPGVVKQLTRNDSGVYTETECNDNPTNCYSESRIMIVDNTIIEKQKEKITQKGKGASIKIQGDYFSELVID